MSKCFITKLPSSVDNDNLPVLGQLRIKWLKQNNLKDNASRGFLLSTNNSITVKVSGAHFTDSTLTSNLGNTKIITADDRLVPLYVSNDTDAVLTIDNKYSLTNLNFVVRSEDVARSVYFDIEDIKYCTNLVNLYLNNTQVSGDISALSNMVNLNSLLINKTQVSGDISALSKLTELNSLYLDNQIGGDIGALSKLTKLTTLNFWGSQVSGDISALSNMINLDYLTITSRLNGDMSKIPASTKFITQYGATHNTFTWTAKGRQNANVLAMEGPIHFDTASMDNMLIDQATCTLKGNDSQPWTKTISVSGTRTSASDAAVTTLQSKGVTITGVTKVS